MDDIGFGVVGVGTWGSLHARVYSNTFGARLRWVCDRDAERARSVAADCGGVPWTTQLSELLSDPLVHAVSVVLPDPLHRDAVTQACRAGKHVLVEKPLATTEADALAMLAAARDAGVTLCVDFHNRFNPLFTGMKDSLTAGELGEPQRIYYRLSDTLFVPTQMLSWSARSSVAWFLASHCLDTLLWLLEARVGRDRVAQVSCVTRSRLLRRRGIETPDFYLSTLEWESGLVTQVENCWILPESGPSVFDLKCDLIGSRGSYSVDGSHHGAAKKLTDRATYPDVLVAPLVHGTPSGFGAESIRHFAHALRTGETPRMDGVDGLAVTRLILKLEEAARAGAPVPVGDLYAV